MQKYYVYYMVCEENNSNGSYHMRDSHSTIHANSAQEAMDKFEQKHPNCSVNTVTLCKR